MARSLFDNTWKTADQSPTLVPLAHIGADVPATTDTVLAAADGRVKVDVCHTGTAGRLWLAVGQAARPGFGNWLDPGDAWSEWTAGAVHVYLDGTASAQRVTGMEWAA